MRFVVFLTLIVLVTMLPWYLMLFLVIGYGLYWNAPYELIFLGLLVDVYFGTTSMIPCYTLGVCAFLLALEWLKPRLLIYNNM